MAGYGPHRTIYLTGIDAKWQGREGFRAQAVQGSELTALAQILVPFETRPGETAKDPYERELRAMARNDDHGRKSQGALPDTA